MGKPRTKNRHFWIILAKYKNCGTGDLLFGPWTRPCYDRASMERTFPTKKQALEYIETDYDGLHAIPVRCTYKEPQIGGEECRFE